MWKNCSNSTVKWLRGITGCFLFLVLLRVIPGLSQVPEVILSFKTEAHSLYTDPMGNIYLVSERGISRYPSESGTAVTYSNIRFGRPEYADVTDPLRILVFYPGFNTLVFLDRYLAELQDPVSLDNLGIQRAGPVCTSPSGGFWVYDRHARRLTGFSQNLLITARSPEIGYLVGDNAIPVYLTEKNNTLYLNIPGKGIALFDRYGAFKNLLPVYPDHEFQVLGNRILFRKGSSLLDYNTETFQTDTLYLSKKEPVYSMQFERNKLYLLFPGEVQVIAYTR